MGFFAALKDHSGTSFLFSTQHLFHLFYKNSDIVVKDILCNVLISDLLIKILT